MTDARTLIDRLQLAPHPEGGWYRETWRAAPTAHDARGAATSILFLLEAGQRSHWHRVDASELWIHQAGATLDLHVADGPDDRVIRLGTDVRDGALPQHLVAPGQWQAAHAVAGWCLVACVVVPAFRFEGFEMAPPGWTPADGEPPVTPTGSGRLVNGNAPGRRMESIDGSTSRSGP